VLFFNAAGGGIAHAFQVSLIPLAALPLAAAVAVQFVPRLRPAEPAEPAGPTGPAEVTVSARP
jgi:hypothetical protein